MQGLKNVTLFLLLIGSMVAIYLSAIGQKQAVPPYVLELDPKVPLLQVSFADTEVDYMCLASGEYGQPYLPEEFQCFGCQMSEDDRNKLENWSATEIVLIYRVRDRFTVDRVDLTSIEGKSIHTSYRSVSSRGGRLGGKNQCVKAIAGTASCADFKRECLPLFEAREPPAADNRPLADG